MWRLLLLVGFGCVAPGLHGGAQLAIDSDRHVVLQVAAGGDSGFTGGEVDSANALLALGFDVRLGVELRSGSVVGGFKVAALGFARQVPDEAWGHRAMAGVLMRFSRRGVTMGPHVEYWREPVIEASFDPGPCSDEGTSTFRSIGTGLAVDVAFGAGRRVVTATAGSHYLWSPYVHAHPLTECPGVR